MNSEESKDYKSDQGVCYGMVIEFIFIYSILLIIYDKLFIKTKYLLLAEILLEDCPPLNLALVQWYDFKFTRNLYKYGCLTWS